MQKKRLVGLSYRQDLNNRLDQHSKGGKTSVSSLIDSIQNVWIPNQKRPNTKLIVGWFLNFEMKKMVFEFLRMISPKLQISYVVCCCKLNNTLYSLNIFYLTSKQMNMPISTAMHFCSPHSDREECGSGLNVPSLCNFKSQSKLSC